MTGNPQDEERLARRGVPLDAGRAMVRVEPRSGFPLSGLSGSRAWVVGASSQVHVEPGHVLMAVEAVAVLPGEGARLVGVKLGGHVWFTGEATVARIETRRHRTAGSRHRTEVWLVDLKRGTPVRLTSSVDEPARWSVEIGHEQGPMTSFTEEGEVVDFVPAWTTSNPQDEERLARREGQQAALEVSPGGPWRAGVLATFAPGSRTFRLDGRVVRLRDHRATARAPAGWHVRAWRVDVQGRWQWAFDATEATIDVQRQVVNVRSTWGGWCHSYQEVRLAPVPADAPPPADGAEPNPQDEERLARRAGSQDHGQGGMHVRWGGEVGPWNAEQTWTRRLHVAVGGSSGLLLTPARAASFAAAGLVDVRAPLGHAVTAWTWRPAGSFLPGWTRAMDASVVRLQATGVGVRTVRVTGHGEGEEATAQEVVLTLDGRLPNDARDARPNPQDEERLARRGGGVADRLLTVSWSRSAASAMRVATLEASRSYGGATVLRMDGRADRTWKPFVVSAPEGQSVAAWTWNDLLDPARWSFFHAGPAFEVDWLAHDFLMVETPTATDGDHAGCGATAVHFRLAGTGPPDGSLAPPEARRRPNPQDEERLARRAPPVGPRVQLHMGKRDPLVGDFFRVRGVDGAFYVVGSDGALVARPSKLAWRVPDECPCCGETGVDVDYDGECVTCMQGECARSQSGQTHSEGWRTLTFVAPGGAVLYVQGQWGTHVVRQLDLRMVHQRDRRMLAVVMDGTTRPELSGSPESLTITAQFLVVQERDS